MNQDYNQIQIELFTKIDRTSLIWSVFYVPNCRNLILENGFFMF
jgi:hypothetical protein